MSNITRKIEPKAVAIGAVISVVGSVFLAVFVIFWAGFIVASSGEPGLQMDKILSVRAIGLSILLVDVLVGLAAGFVAGRLASAHPIAQGMAVGFIALVIGLLPIAGMMAPWRLLLCDSIVLFVSPVFGAKFVEWRRQRHASDSVVA